MTPGTRIRYNRDVKMGNRDALWTIPAGTGGIVSNTTCGFSIRLDTPINGSEYVYADPTSVTPTSAAPETAFPSLAVFLRIMTR